MGKCILAFLGVLSIIYGIMVSKIGSGTLFWLIWEAIGGAFLIWALLIHNGFFAAHKKIQIVFYALVIVVGVSL
mgnify:FL=1